MARVSKSAARRVARGLACLVRAGLIPLGLTDTVSHQLVEYASTCLPSALSSLSLGLPVWPC